MPTIDPNNPIVKEIERRARKAPRKKRARYTAAALQTGGVESGFRNLPGGDADSAGWRQERASIYKDPTNVKASVDRFFNELAQHDRGQPSYELAADVQRPAAQYRGRYKDWHAASMKLIGGAGGAARVPSGSGTPAARATTTTRTTETYDQEGYEKAVAKQKVAQLLQRGGRGSSVLFRSGLLSTDAPDPKAFQSTATQQVTVPGQAASQQAGQLPSSDQVSTAIKAARNRLGIKEDNGSNRSAEVDKLQQGFGMIGQPWCGIYVGTVLKRAGVRGVDSRVASVPEIEAMARRKEGAFAGGWHSAKHAKKGDALITRQGEHVAFVEDVDADGTIHVIGGNQGTGEVNRRTWKPEQVFGVARPAYQRSRSRRKKAS